MKIMIQLTESLTTISLFLYPEVKIKNILQRAEV